MQNQIVNCTFKSLWSAMPGHVNRGMPSLTHQRYVPSYLTSELYTREFSERRITPHILPGGGLEKFQGRFKEEKYFNTNDHILLARIQKTGYRLKCENDVSNWKEFERMATACTKVIAQRQTGMLNKNRNNVEESFFLQEQKSLLDRILEVLKRLTYNRRMPGSPFPHGTPFGPYYQHGTPFQPEMHRKNPDNDETKNDNDNENNENNENNEVDNPDQASDADLKASENLEEHKNESGNNEDWSGPHDHDHDDHSNNGSNEEK